MPDANILMKSVGFEFSTALQVVIVISNNYFVFKKFLPMLENVILNINLKFNILLNNV